MRSDSRIVLAGRHHLIDHHRGRYEVKAMCAFFGVSRAAYYAWRKKSSGPDRDQVRMKLVEEAFIASRRTYPPMTARSAFPDRNPFFTLLIQPTNLSK